MEKKYFLILLLAYQFTIGYAQYVPNNSQAFQFMPVYNPAFTGIENFDDLKLSYRYQWAGFGANAPKFVNLSFNTRIKQPLDLSYNSSRLSDFANAKVGRLPPGKRIIHAVGLNLFHSTVGVLKSVGASFNYTINYPITQKSRIAFGGSALLENRKLDVSQVTVREPDEFYDYLLRSSTSQTDVNVRVGVAYYGERFYIGASYLPLINFALRSSDLAMEEPFYRGTLQAGYGFQASDQVAIKSSVMALVRMDNNVNLDYNVKAYFENKVWLGLTYRDIDSGVVLLGFNINERFTASYSYEMSVGDFRTFEDGSHELVLAARFKNLRRFNQYLW